MALGSVLKEIRMNKGLSQQSVAHKIMSQGVYSKIEAGARDLDAEAFLKISNRLNLTPDEIDFINNEYDYNEKQKIINDFFKLNYNHPNKLMRIKEQAMHYLTKGDDVELREVYLLCEALLIVSDSDDIEKARDLIEPIWKRLKTYDQWYLYDIRLINMMLFMYPLETTISISRRVLQRLDDYSKHEKVSHLKDIYTINLSLLLIKIKRYEDALIMLEQRLLFRKDMSYTMLALTLERRAICKKQLTIAGYEEDLFVVENLLRAYEAEDLLTRIEEEFNKYALQKDEVI